MLHGLKNLYAKRLNAHGNIMTAKAIERRLFIVVGGGLNQKGKRKLEAEILDRLDWLGDDHPELKRIRYLFIVKSMADAAAMVRQFVRASEVEPAFHASASVIIFVNKTLEAVNHQWVRDHYSFSLHDHMPHPVIFPNDADVISINFDSYPGKDGTPECAWQDLFPKSTHIRTVNPETWLSALAETRDVSIQRIISRRGTELGNALIAAASDG